VDAKILKDIEDRLMAGLELDAYERSLYYHLVRHTRAEGKESALFSIAKLAKRLGMSDYAVRDRVRSMDKKGCIKVEERSKDGHHIRVLLPDEIQHLPSTDVREDPVDIEAIDFYSERRWADVLLKREGSRCFYCLRELVSNWVLDHVVPAVNGGGNSYRNVVACCHECNAAKQASSARNFLRELYRRGLLAPPEFEARTLALGRLESGDLVPEI
jgi:5-methylcytosine-specific restriction endonuclease McrA/predicted DNA-binding transcriptional regulator